ncbi:MAG: response regulator transcription factor [Prevotella sp.]|nr:response regulator transcription factor [Prevotella sp.]
MKRILIIDDEHDLCEILAFNLNAEGYDTTIAHSATEALEEIEKSKSAGTNFDLLLLDVMMDGMSGFELAKELKKQIPIIFLTAKDTEEDKLQGFSLGADDYIAKPFSVREVLARINAVLGRTANMKPETLTYKGLTVNLSNKTVQIDKKNISLTRTEFEILVLLLSEQYHVFTRQELLDRVWPDDVVVTDRTVDVNITRLRKKIGSYAGVIATRQGYGYCFEEI